MIFNRLEKILVLIVLLSILINLFMLFQIYSVKQKMVVQGEDIRKFKDELSNIEESIVNVQTSSGKILTEINNILMIPEEEREKITSDLNMEEYRENANRWINYDFELANYLKDGDYIICTEKVNEIAVSLVDINSLTDTVDNMANWVIENIEYPNNPEESKACNKLFTSDEILKIGEGCCLSDAILFCSMSRCLGIPCRVVIGVTSDEKTHAWAEIGYFSDDSIGWSPIETTTGTEITLQRYLQKYGKKALLNDYN